MNKNKFFEKVGKLTFSVVLTWVLVTWIVVAGTTWQTYNDDDIISGNQWQLMVSEIQNKVSAIDLPDLTNFYTKTESDTNFTTSAEVIESVMNTCKICIAQGDRDNSANFSSSDSNHTYACADFWSVWRLNVLWKMNSDDQLAFKIECGIPGVWWTSTTSAYTWSCGNKRVTNNEKTWFCSKSKPGNTYYAWETSCVYFETIPKSWEPIEIERDWFKYSSKKTQTCN